MHYSDRSCWAARGRAAREELRGRASLKGGDSDAHARQAEDGSSSARHSIGRAGGSRADVRLLGLGRAE